MYEEYIRPFMNYSIPDEKCLYGNKVLELLRRIRTMKPQAALEP
jgi:hypothetical protein